MSSEASVIARIQRILQDSSTAVYGTAEIQSQIAEDLVTVAQYSPNVGLATVTTSAGTKWVDITDVSNLLYGFNEESFQAVEFREDKDPPRFRNFEVKEKRLYLDIEFDPDASEDVRLYVRQPHTLSGATNSMSAVQEDLLANLVAAKLAISKGRSDLVAWGALKWTETRNRLERIAEDRMVVRYPRQA